MEGFTNFEEAFKESILGFKFYMDKRKQKEPSKSDDEIIQDMFYDYFTTPMIKHWEKYYNEEKINGKIY